MGIPIVAPSLRLLSSLHSTTGIMGHKVRWENAIVMR